MSKHAVRSSLFLILLASTGCSQTKQQSAATTQPDQQSTPAATRYLESVNSVSGSFALDAFFSEDKKTPFTITLSHAYARLVKNGLDPSKQDVLIVLSEKPLAQVALARLENDDAVEGFKNFEKAMRARDLRGFVFRLAVDRKAAADTEEKIKKLRESSADFSEDELRKGGDSRLGTYFKGSDAEFGFVSEVKSFSVDKVEGHITRIPPSDSFNADVNFTVKLQPHAWTGGIFYQQPATKLAPGRASGQFEVDGKPLKIGYAYVRLVEYDFFDETKNTFKLWLTENPVEESAFGDDSADKLLAMKRAGNSAILAYNTTGPNDHNEVVIWDVKRMPEDASKVDYVTLRFIEEKIAVEADYVRFDQNTVEGRLYWLFKASSMGTEFKIDLLFNATLLPPAVSERPVTASEGGEALPPDGGAPVKAYLQAMERMRSATNFEQTFEVWTSVITAEQGEKIKRDRPSWTPEAQQLFYDVLRPIENPRILGGLIKGDRATLRVSGAKKGEKILQVANLQLEGGHWKISSTHTRVE